MINVSFRKAQVSDAAEILQAEQTIAQNPGIFCSNPSELLLESVQSTITRLEKTGRGIYLIAEIDGKAIAHGFLDPLCPNSRSHVVELSIAVHPGWQDRGIGRKLMEKMLQFAHSNSWIEKIELWVRSENHRARALYKKYGFIEEGRLVKRVKVGTTYYDDIVMGLFIPSNKKT